MNECAVKDPKQTKQLFISLTFPVQFTQNSSNTLKNHMHTSNTQLKYIYLKGDFMS